MLHCFQYKLKFDYTLVSHFKEQPDVDLDRYCTNGSTDCSVNTVHLSRLRYTVLLYLYKRWINGRSTLAQFNTIIILAGSTIVQRENKCFICNLYCNNTCNNTIKTLQYFSSILLVKMWYNRALFSHFVSEILPSYTDLCEMHESSKISPLPCNQTSGSHSSCLEPHSPLSQFMTQWQTLIESFVLQCASSVQYSGIILGRSSRQSGEPKDKL